MTGSEGEARIERIRRLLTEALAPIRLEIRDESALHAGHAGAREGHGHFRVLIVSDQFEGRSVLERHRLVYAALGDMMETDIHALALRAKTAQEAREHATD